MTAGLKRMLQSTCCWVGRVAKCGVGGAWRLPRWTLLGRGEEKVAATDDKRRCHRYGGRRWVGSSPAAGAAVPFNGDAYNDEGGGLRNLKADSPPPPPSWLVCEFCLPERMNKKDK